MSSSELRSRLGRRGFLGLAGAAGAGAALAACAGPSTSGPNTSGGKAGASAAPNGAPDFSGVKPASKITFWTNNPGSSQQVSQKLINKFRAQSNIQVELVTAGANYDDIAQKFQTAQAGGSLPDVIVLSDVWWFRYYLQHSIIPLDTAIKAASINSDDYVATFWNDYQYKGSQWAVPWARSTPLFYYNRDAWAKAGLPDRAPKTWEEFGEWAPKLKAADTGAQHVYEYSSLTNTPAWVDQNILWGQGTAFSEKESFTLTMNSADTIAAVQSIQDNIYKNKWAVMAGNNETNDFSAGASCATIASTGGSTGIQAAAKFRVGVGFIPGGPKVTDPVCPTGGAGFGIPAKIPVANQLAAAKFIQFMTTADSTLAFCAATGYLPVRKNVDTATLKKANPLVQPPLDQLAHTRSQDWARVFIPGADNAMATAFQKICSQQADVKSTFDALQTQVQGLYDQQVKPVIGG